MEQLLAELQTDGRLDSSGVFTLDFVKASDKLREFQLAEPHLYILKLIQSAVASEATAVSIVTSGTTLQLSYDGLSIAPEQLEGLVNCLLDPLKVGAERQLVHLAVGLNSCLGCGVDQIIVESWKDGQGAALVLTDQLQQTGRVVGKSRRSGTRLFLRKRGLPLQQMFRPELEALAQRAVYCPIPITVNLSRITHGRFGRPALPPFLRPFQPALRVANRVGRIFNDAIMRTNQPNTMGREAEPVMPWWVLIWNVDDYVFGQCHRHHHLFERRHEGAGLGLAASTASLREPPESVRKCSRVLALQADLQANALLTFVGDGVILCQVEEDLRCNGAVALVTAEGLSTDLSQFGIITNGAYRDRRQELKREFQEITAGLVARLHHDSLAIPLGRHVLSRLKRKA